MAGADWEITNHCCRACFSRILRKAIVQSDRDYVYRCTGCGIEGEGEHPRAICSCGMTTGRTGKNMGVRCVVNDKVTPEVPFQVVARQVGSGR